MKKIGKIAAFIAAAALSAGIAVTAVACGNGGEEHEHTFATEWSYDETNHWHAATCEHKDERADVAAHTFEDGVCTVCGYEEEVEAPAYLTPTNDAEHWFDYTVEDFITEDVSDKKIAYQFNGTVLNKFNVNLQYVPGAFISINLYEDGFVKAVEYSRSSASGTYEYYGYWLNNDGESISIMRPYMRYVADESGTAVDGETIEVAYNTTDIVKNAEGKFEITTSVSMAIVEGSAQFVRTLTLTQTGEIVFDTEEEFLEQAAKDYPVLAEQVKETGEVLTGDYPVNA